MLYQLIGDQLETVVLSTAGDRCNPLVRVLSENFTVAMFFKDVPFQMSHKTCAEKEYYPSLFSERWMMGYSQIIKQQFIH